MRDAIYMFIAFPFWKSCYDEQPGLVNRNRKTRTPLDAGGKAYSCVLPVRTYSASALTSAFPFLLSLPALQRVFPGFEIVNGPDAPLDPHGVRDQRHDIAHALVRHRAEETLCRDYGSCC